MIRSKSASARIGESWFTMAYRTAMAERMMECSMVMRMVEAYVNEENMDRKGIMLFLDMEKAFDRVSYDFINKGIDAVGFGKHFRNMVGLMYDPTDPPKRRMYVCE